MNKYELLVDEKGSEIVKRTNADDTISWIPTDPANSDYQSYLAWLEDPNAEITPPIL